MPSFLCSLLLHRQSFVCSLLLQCRHSYVRCYYISRHSYVRCYFRSRHPYVCCHYRHNAIILMFVAGTIPSLSRSLPLQYRHYYVRCCYSAVSPRFLAATVPSFLFCCCCYNAFIFVFVAVTCLLFVAHHRHYCVCCCYITSIRCCYSTIFLPRCFHPPQTVPQRRNEEEGTRAWTWVVAFIDFPI